VTAVPPPRIAIVADDLLWSERLTAQARQAGADPVVARDLARLEAVLATAPALVVVDLTSRAYDGLGAVRVAASAGRPVLALGQHDDLDLRHAALDAGAERVLAYRKMASDGVAVLSVLLTADRPSGPRPVDHRDADEGAS
jgi:DNA-binding response OmpR family regulator